MATEKKPAKSTGKKSASKKAEERNIEEEKKKSPYLLERKSTLKP